MNFSSKINDRIDRIAAQAKEVQQKVADPLYHVESIQKVINEAIIAVEGLPDDPALLRQEFISALSQVPGAVASTWKSAADNLRDLHSEISKWKEMGELYDEWQREQEMHHQREQEIKQEIISGEIKEPTRQEAIRRQAGTRPAVTLGQFRRLSSQLESGEDSEG